MAISDHERTLGRIEAKLDTALETLNDHKEKIAVLEKFRTQVLMVAVGVSFAIGTLREWLVHKVWSS